MKKECDPFGIQQNMPGAKLDSGKMLPWLFISGFPRALNEVIKVTTFGSKKYSHNGWAYVEDGANRYMEAFGRHLMAFAKGEVIDEDSRCLHKAQMIWNLLASLELEFRGIEEKSND